MTNKQKIPITTYYVWILLLTAVGIALSIYLIPTPSDIAYIALQSQRFDTARDYYAQQYQSGVRTPNLLFHLTELELKQGHVDQAILYMEELVNAYPSNISALKYLKDLYLSSQRYNQYIETLQKLQTAEKEQNIVDLQTLQALAKWRTTQNQSERAENILRDIIATKRGTAENYLNLATLLIENKQYDEALHTLNERRKRFPDAIQLENIFLEIWVIAKIDEGTKNGTSKNQAIDLLSRFLYEKQNVETTEAALYYFGSHYPSWSPLFIRKIYPLIAGHPILEQIAATDLWYNSLENADKKLAIARITEAYKNKPKDPELQNLYFEMIQSKQYTALVTDFIKRADLTHLTSRHLNDFSYWALLNKHCHLARKMLSSLSTNYLEQHPVDHITLLIAAYDPQAETQLNAFLRTDHSKTDLLALFRMAIDAKMEESALKIGAALLRTGAFTSDELAEIAFGFIQLKHSEDFRKQFQRVRTKTSFINQGAALALLSADSGQSARSATWLCSQKQVSETLLSNLYIVAVSREEYPLALYVAKRLKKAHPSPQTEAYYALELVRVGKVDKGMSLIKPLYEKQPDNEEMVSTYFDALAAATKVTPKYAEQLSAFMRRQESKGCLAPDILRTYAYVYLETLHDFEKAEKIFFKLAQLECPLKDDLQMLLDLWGPCVSHKQACFILAGATNSLFLDLSFWLQRLNTVGMYCDVVSIAQSKLGAGLSIEAQIAYMDALYHLHLYTELKDVIDLVFNEICDREQLAVLANYAGAIENYETQRFIWEKVVRLYPNDLLAWQSLGDVAFYQNDDCGTASALFKFFSLYQQSDKPNPLLYVSLYQYGVIMERHFCCREALACYYSALSHICNCVPASTTTKEYEALIWQKLREPARALSLMSEYYTMTSRDPEAGASFAQMMMDVGAWSSAAFLIGNTIGY